MKNSIHDVAQLYSPARGTQKSTRKNTTLGALPIAMLLSTLHIMVEVNSTTVPTIVKPSGVNRGDQEGRKAPYRAKLPF